jgi:hypothetical protein
MLLKDILNLLSDNKKYPKYQHERRIDIFVNYFLADILKARFGHPVDLVIPEFPLKEPGSSLSTNIDYLAYSKSANTVFICEFKTDYLSYRKEQTDRYLKALEDHWDKIMDDVRQIRNNTSPAYQSKYDFLLDRAKIIPADVSRRIVYIAPERARKSLALHIKPPKFEFLALEDLRKLDIATPFIDEWLLVRDSLSS